MVNYCCGYKMEVSQILLNYMKGEGVEYFFGIPGGHIGSFFDALYDVTPDVKTILPKHEQGAHCCPFKYPMV